MSSNAQKTPLARTLNRFAAQKALDAIQLLGKGLPASIVAVSGSIVTVKFEVDAAPFTLPQVTMPRGGSQWAREPTQVGDKGYVVPGDFYLGGMSGLGGGTANLTQQGNLAALVWWPIGNTAFFPVNPNAYVIYGPDGVVLRDTTGASSLTLTPTTLAVDTPDTITITAGTSIELTAAGHTILINSTGVVIDGKVFLTHEHTGVQSGGSNTGGVA